MIHKLSVSPSISRNYALAAMLPAESLLGLSSVLGCNPSLIIRYKFRSGYGENFQRWGGGDHQEEEGFGGGGGSAEAVGSFIHSPLHEAGQVMTGRDMDEWSACRTPLC